MKKPTIKFYDGDLPADMDWGDAVAIDTETMGLMHGRDRLCLVQLSKGDGVCHLVRIREGQDYTNLCEMLADPEIQKIYHFGRFDIASIYAGLGVLTVNVFCTKIASKLVRTYTDRHGLKDLCKQFLGVELSKQQQQSDWGADDYTDAQKEYAASDVLYLHELRDVLDAILVRENRQDVAYDCFEFLPTRAFMDLQGFGELDIFSH